MNVSSPLDFRKAGGSRPGTQDVRLQFRFIRRRRFESMLEVGPRQLELGGSVANRQPRLPARRDSRERRARAVHCAREVEEAAPRLAFDSLPGQRVQQPTTRGC